MKSEVEALRRECRNGDYRRLTFEALIRACKAGDIETVRFLVEESPKYTKRKIDASADSFSALEVACMAGQAGVVKYLIEDGSKHTAKAIDPSKLGGYALGCADDSDGLSILRYLCEESPKYTGVKMDLSIDDNYILEEACIKNKLSTVRYLIEESHKHTGIPINPVGTIKMLSICGALNREVAEYMKSRSGYAGDLAKTDALIREYTEACKAASSKIESIFKPVERMLPRVKAISYKQQCYNDHFLNTAIKAGFITNFEQLEKEIKKQDKLENVKSLCTLRA